MIILYIVMAVAVLIAVYCRMLKTNSKRAEKMVPFEKVYIAHRGAHNLVIPENSLRAFQRAIEAGNGIEIDVRLTKDGIPVVIHDNSLKRVCGVNEKVSELNYDKLKEYCLSGSDQSIPSLQEVLALVNGRVPIIIEIKIKFNCHMTCVKVSEMLKNYKGIYCIQSFYASVLIWFRKNCPEVLRGQLTSDMWGRGISKGKIASGLTTGMLNNWRTQPDFIAYCHKDAGRWVYKLCRVLYNPVCAGWTIRSEKELEKAQKEFNIIIYDNIYLNGLKD